jgi:hypothetical protein
MDKKSYKNKSTELESISSNTVSILVYVDRKHLETTSIL